MRAALTIHRIRLTDINLYTSRGDGNLSYFVAPFLYLTDINLYTSRGDGNVNFLTYSNIIHFDINLYTSRGDGNAGVSLVLGAVLGKVRI